MLMYTLIKNTLPKETKISKVSFKKGEISIASNAKIGSIKGSFISLKNLIFG